MSILNVNQIQPVGSGQTVTISAANITASGGNFVGNVTGNATGLSGSPTLSGITSISTTNLTVNGNAYPATGPLSNRNIIINGGMAVSQRGTSFNLAHDGTTADWTLDRFRVTMSGADQWDCTVTQSSDTPVGFTSSLLITTGTAETTVDAAEYMSVQYKVEAQDLQQIASGTSDAKDMILSFWIKSSQTGTFAFGIYKADETQRGLSATYTINAADTWEQKTISIPGDTGSGGIDNNNGLGMNFYWLLAAGSDWTSTDSTSWINYVTTGLAYGHAQNGVITNAGATWAITGVQLEVGSVATPFEHRSYGDELARCKRYFQATEISNFGLPGYAISSTQARFCASFFPEMRDDPTLTTDTLANFAVQYTNSSATTTAMVFSGVSQNNARIIATVASGLTAGQGVSLLGQNVSFPKLYYSAEL